MAIAAFIPRPNSGSCPTSWKFIEVPGVPPPGPTVTPSGCTAPPSRDITPPDAPATGAASNVMARQVIKVAETGRRLIVVPPCTDSVARYNRRLSHRRALKATGEPAPATANHVAIAGSTGSSVVGVSLGSIEEPSKALLGAEQQPL